MAHLSPAQYVRIIHDNVTALTYEQLEQLNRIHWTSVVREMQRSEEAYSPYEISRMVRDARHHALKSHGFHLSQPANVAEMPNHLLPDSVRLRLGQVADIVDRLLPFKA